MISNNKDIPQNLIPGRAGELTHYANRLTFSLLKKIFDYGGPYQKVLMELGVDIAPTTDSYLVLNEGIVYSDISKEEKILWGKYPLRYNKKNGQLVLGLGYSFSDIVRYPRLFKKSVKDSLIILHIEDYFEKICAKYKDFSDFVVSIFASKKITLDEFLTAYECVVYVTYFFELLDMYNVDKPTYTQEIKDYLLRNDYLLGDNTRFIESYLKLDKGFYLDDYTNLDSKLQDLKLTEFIPHSIERLFVPEVNKLFLIEKELQCLKNNLRLKTNVLLFFLNYSLLNIASSKGISKIADITLDDLLL